MGLWGLAVIAAAAFLSAAAAITLLKMHFIRNLNYDHCHTIDRYGLSESIIIDSD